MMVTFEIHSITFTYIKISKNIEWLIHKCNFPSLLIPIKSVYWDSESHVVYTSHAAYFNFVVLPLLPKFF